MWFNIEASLFLAMYGPRIATKWPVVVTTTFVPLYLGFESITREQIIKDHTRPLAKTLLGGDDDGLIPVLDGTYIYIFKKATISLFKQEACKIFTVSIINIVKVNLILIIYTYFSHMCQ
jgi:hypothetical protein